MMFKFIDEILKSQLPLYVTGRLPRYQRRIVEAWLHRSPRARARLEALRLLKSDLDAENRLAAEPAIWPRLDVRASARTGSISPAKASTWGYGMVLGLLLFLFAWFAIPPAVEIQWSVSGTSPKEFRVYRAEGPVTGTFELVEAIPANDPVTTYSFRDYLLVPGREYIYRIEAIGPNNEALANDWVTGDSFLVLPGQIALITASLISLYGIWVYVDRTGVLRNLQNGNHPI